LSTYHLPYTALTTSGSLHDAINLLFPSIFHQFFINFSSIFHQFFINFSSIFHQFFINFSSHPFHIHLSSNIRLHTSIIMGAMLFGDNVTDAQKFKQEFEKCQKEMADRGDLATKAPEKTTRDTEEEAQAPATSESTSTPAATTS
jgi:hypothetical protein